MKEREADRIFKEQAIYCEKICDKLDNLGYRCEYCNENCCYGQTIGILRSELTQIANHLNISKSEFRRKYTTISLHPSRNVRVRCFKPIIDDDGKEVCRFLIDNRCSIYPVRPSTCKGFPFYLHSKRELVSIHGEISCVKVFGFNKILKEFIKDHNIDKISTTIDGVPHIRLSIVKEMLGLD